jgi:hypothetical protein
MFEKKLPKHKDMLDATIFQASFKTININTWNAIFSYIFIDFHNCFITITYLVNSRSILTLTPPRVVDQPWFCFIFILLTIGILWPFIWFFVDVVNRCTSVSSRLLRLDFHYANVSLFVCCNTYIVKV